MKGRTYRYFEGKPLYGFGYGMSYTSFAYSRLKAPASVAAGQAVTGQAVTIEGEVKNTGRVAGDEVAELYLTQPRGFETPVRVLAGFTRVHLAAGASAHVGFTIDPRSLGQVDEKGVRRILPGEYTVYLGGAQPGEGNAGQTAKFTVTGSAELPK
jgi:beta-glucosidase